MYFLLTYLHLFVNTYIALILVVVVVVVLSVLSGCPPIRAVRRVWDRKLTFPLFFVGEKDLMRND